MDVYKKEHFIDLMKGACEMANYKLVESESSESKSYWYDKDSMGVSYRGELNIYRMSEVINLAVKILNYIGFNDLRAVVETNIEGIVDNLQLVDIDTDLKEVKTGSNDTLSFEIRDDSKVLAVGQYDSTKKSTEFTINLSDLEEGESPQETIIDAYIVPKDEKVLSDAFAITTNLRDSGFKVEANYELDKDINYAGLANFMISFDSKDIGNYEIWLKDLKTNEERKVMIDNIVEELMFI